jgi:hypothetical protein
MTTKTTTTVFAVIFLGAASATSADPFPGIDVQKMCRASEAVSFADSTQTFDVCMSDERAARDRLVEDWANVPARDKARCVLPTEYLPSYVEWLTCLEMERELKKIRQTQPDERHARLPPG